MIEILFVCTGNTCRSPMAEALLNDKAKKLNIPLHASSAGLAAFTGDSASAYAIEVMNEIGIDLSSHRSSRLSIYAFEESDIVVCMSESHKAALPASYKIIVPNGGISDPYGGDINIYRVCRDELSEFIDLLIASLSEIRISKMNEKHIKAVAEIEKECFSVPWSENALREELTNENAHFYVAELFGETVGYIGMHIVLDEAYIANVAVSKKYRRRSIGSKLVVHAINTAKKANASFISLEVRESNTAAISLYKQHGFAICGERKNFYDEPKENGLIMTKFFDKD